MSSIGEIFSSPADEFVNDPEIEHVWAMKAIEHMTVYFNLISSMPASQLRLTSKDDLILGVFEQQFPDFRVDVITEPCLKSDEAKAKWRQFCNQFEHEVDDFNWATMLRLNCAEDYSESNTILVTRIQFLAIEIARNRRGLNDPIHEKFGKSSDNQN
jgi:hypothetical protein